MNSRLQFQLGLLLLVVGVAISAGFGARLGPDDYAHTAAQGRMELAEDSSLHQHLPENQAATLASPGPSQRLNSWWAMAGWPFAAGLLLVAGGALLARHSLRPDATADSTTDRGEPGFADLLQQLDQRLEGLADSLADSLAASQKVPQSSLAPSKDNPRQILEQIQLELVEVVVARRDQLTRQFGLAGQAAVISPFSGAERLLNRCWSALVDGHQPEAAASVETARQYLAEAQAALTQLQSSGAQNNAN